MLVLREHESCARGTLGFRSLVGLTLHSLAAAGRWGVPRTCPQRIASSTSYSSPATVGLFKRFSRAAAGFSTGDPLPAKEVLGCTRAGNKNPRFPGILQARGVRKLGHPSQGALSWRLGSVGDSRPPEVAFALVACLLGRSASVRAGGTPLSVAEVKGVGDFGVATRTVDLAPPDAAAARTTGGPAVAYGAESFSPPSRVDGVLGQPAHAAAVAPAAGCAALDVSAPATGSADDRGRRAGPRPTPRTRQPGLELSAHSRRATRAWSRGLGELGACDPDTPRVAAGARTRRRQLAAVPAPAGDNDAGLRLPHRRDDLAHPHLRPLLRLARASTDRVHRKHEKPGRPLDRAAGPEPVDAARRPWAVLPLPPSRPRQQIQRRLQRDLP